MKDSIDVFLCHASEDKEAVVRPIARALAESHLTYWLDEHEILWGDSIVRKINSALSASKFVIAIISSNSLRKGWPTKELDSALARMVSSKRFRVLPLLVGVAGDRFRKKYRLLEDVHYEKWTGDPASVVESLRRLLDSTELVSPSEIERRTRVRRARGKLKGEVFLIELLTQPIELERSDAGVTITVDRRDVSECVVTNRGKQRLIDDFIGGKRKVISSLKAKDRKIQRFLTGESPRRRMTVSPRELKVPLRWASGGVLSVVKYRGREWVPLFFRDIPPYGWNISLGSTERRFDEQGQPISDRDLEHRCPWDLISREFLEESIVLDHDPANRSEPGAFRRFKGPLPWPGPSVDRWRRHVRLRRERDGLASDLNGSPIQLEPVGPERPATLKIVSSPPGGEPPDEVSDVLVCFSLLDLGIEVVEVARYELNENDYLLDGEIDQEGCLVRMPMALFSLPYLAETFSRDENWYRYVNPFHEGEPPSIRVARAPKEDEVVFFPWDVEQRLKIIAGEMGSDHERTRFTDWRARFRTNFLDRHGRPSLARPSRLFVPATAKVLNLYFSGARQPEPAHG